MMPGLRDLVGSRGAQQSGYRGKDKGLFPREPQQVPPLRFASVGMTNLGVASFCGPLLVEYGTAAIKRLCQVAVRVPRVKASARWAVSAAVVIMALLACGRAHAAVCTTLSSGASQSTLQSALNSCGSGNTVALAAGTFGPITSTVTIPCGVSIIGPAVAYSQTPNQTATINGSSSNGGFGFKYGSSACGSSTPTATFQYFAWNGQKPSNSGGFIELPSGTNNVVIENDWFYGANTVDPSSGESTSAGQIYLCCAGTPGSTTNNITIEKNIFGSTSLSDCSTVMSDTSSPEVNDGGFCNGVGMGGNMTNVYVEYNIFHWLEQGTKYYDTEAEANNVYISYNAYSNIHRNFNETQASGGGSLPVLMYVTYNSFTTPYNGTQGWFSSSANGCLLPNGSEFTATNCATHTDYNVMIQELSGQALGAAIEEWGGASGTTASYNWIQGYPYNGIQWSLSGNFVDSNNVFTMTYGTYNGGYGKSSTNCQVYSDAGWWSPEYTNFPSQKPGTGGSFLPTCSGNTFNSPATNGAAATGTIASATPTISPASGSFTTSQTVTFTNPGTNRDTNTGIWYTTDGSTPTPGSGTAQYIASGGTIAVSTTTTVKAVGMWGAINQPYSYPSGYGYVPSAVVSATYTAGTSPTLNSVTLSTAGSVTTIATGASVQMSAACHYNNGTTTSCNTTDAYGNSVSIWNTSSTSIATISGSGLATGVAVGTANLTAVAAGVTSSPFALSVTAPAVTLTSVTLAGTGGATTVVAGSTNQLIATCHYSDGSTTTCTTTDSHGNAPSSWSSTASTIATVSSGGLVTGVAAGSTNLTAVVAGITSSPALTITVTAAPPTLTGGYLGTPGSANTMVVGGTLQFSAYCTYSNSTTTNCSVADMYGNAVTTWASSNTVSVTIGAAGSANPGLATAVGAGTPYIQAHVGTVALNQWNLTVTAPTVSLTGVSLATTGGVTGLFVGNTNQLVATCAYSDGSTTNCTTTDSHGNVAGSYSSSSGAHATVGASTGLVTGVAAGTTNLTAQTGGFTSPGLPLTVLAIPSGVYIITLSGPVLFSGAVRF
jgi:hypothetical protein